MSNENYIYNSTKLYKNNIPIELNIDTICEQLYNAGGNKELFDKIMKGIENDVMTSESVLKTNIDSENIPQSNSMNFVFKATIPEGELIETGPYQSKILHKKYNDVNANTKYYYPENDNTNNEINKSQWTNRANRILIDSQNNLMTNSNRVNLSNSMKKNNFMNSLSDYQGNFNNSNVNMNSNINVNSNNYNSNIFNNSTNH